MLPAALMLPNPPMSPIAAPASLVPARSVPATLAIGAAPSASERPAHSPDPFGPGAVGFAAPRLRAIGTGMVAAGGAAAPPGPAGPDPADSARPGAPTAPPGAGVPAPGAGYAWPMLPPPVVRTPFRAPAHAYGPGHRGVDLGGAVGQPVAAARAGIVVFAGVVAGRSLVSVQHDDGLRTTYEPVTPIVVAGDVVPAGAVLGTLAPGHAGCPETCLHWGVRRDRLDYLDPLVLLRAPRVRLLPVPDPRPG